MYAKFRNFPLRINKALGIFRKWVTTTRTTTVVALRDPSGYKNLITWASECEFYWLSTRLCILIRVWSRAKTSGSPFSRFLLTRSVESLTAVRRMGSGSVSKAAGICGATSTGSRLLFLESQYSGSYTQRWKYLYIYFSPNSDYSAVAV